jgi:hypothetical protein
VSAAVEHGLGEIYAAKIMMGKKDLDNSDSLIFHHFPFAQGQSWLIFTICCRRGAV